MPQSRTNLPIQSADCQVTPSERVLPTISSLTFLFSQERRRAAHLQNKQECRTIVYCLTSPHDLYSELDFEHAKLQRPCHAVLLFTTAIMRMTRPLLQSSLAALPLRVRDGGILSPSARDSVGEPLFTLFGSRSVPSDSSSVTL